MIEFKVNDMSCGHCVASVTQALQKSDSAARVEVDLATKQVKVESSQPREVLAQALADAGYPAS